VTTSTGEPSVLASASTSTIHEPKVIGSVIGQTLDRTIEPFHRPGAGPKMVGTPYSMGGIVTPNTPHPCSFVPSLVLQTTSMNWSQVPGTSMPEMNFTVFMGLIQSCGEIVVRHISSFIMLCLVRCGSNWLSCTFKVLHCIGYSQWRLEEGT
jgi:hypothetical protein